MVDMAIDDANQRQQFYNQQVQEEQDRLAEAEKKMMDVQRKTGVLEISGQTSEAIRMVGDLRAKITVLNVQLQALRASATDANPEVQRLKAELEADQTALSKAENSQGATGLGDVGTSEVPQAALEYIHAARDVRYHESLTEALGKQVEAARMDEARSAPAVQIVDPAVPSDHPAGISRTLMVVIGIFIGFVLGLVLAILRQAWWNIKASEEGQEKWRQLVETLQERA
jgi:capsule polysaccharide export protein KpsE/RkpR